MHIFDDSDGQRFFVRFVDGPRVVEPNVPAFPLPPAFLASVMHSPVIHIQSLTVTAGERRLLEDVTLEIPALGVFGLVGASGAGKTTLLKSMNRLLDLTPGVRVHGQVLLRGQPVYDAAVNVDDLRTRIGILFQQPVVFPATVEANVLFGVRHSGRHSRREWPAVVERALREAALWDEVRDRLRAPAHRLSVGQQQRLCLARTLAMEPEVVLMDEPTSALDPLSTEAIEALILRLKQTRTIVLVTHNLGQARRVCDHAAIIGVRDGAGRVLATGTARDVLAEAPAS